MLLAATSIDRQQAESGLGNEVSRVVSYCALIGKLNDGARRVGKWLESAIVRARAKAVLGRLSEAHPRSLAAMLMGTQVPAMVTQPHKHSDSGGSLVLWGLPLPRLEVL